MFCNDPKLVLSAFWAVAEAKIKNSKIVIFFMILMISILIDECNNKMVVFDNLENISCAIPAE